MSGMDRQYRTRVHIAGVPTERQQNCFRCGSLIVDGAAAWSPDGGVARFFAAGRFVGTVERVDGLPVWPKGHFLMEHDAIESDEVRCA